MTKCSAMTHTSSWHWTHPFDDSLSSFFTVLEKNLILVKCPAGVWLLETGVGQAVGHCCLLETQATSTVAILELCSHRGRCSVVLLLIPLSVAERVEDSPPCRHHFGQFLCLAEKPQPPEWHSSSSSWCGCVGHTVSGSQVATVSTELWFMPSHGGITSLTHVLYFGCVHQERHLCWNEPAVWDSGSVPSVWDVSTTPQLQHQWRFRTTRGLHRCSRDGPQVSACYWTSMLC